ncbi:nucleotidyltransferase domain-containing protein [Oscillatoria sp. FACHB-1406]|uniref:nucleotidyltransferase domain-containing protein n=1 Tax=Oscillatoria sp. FACHB-1406 TaxID=2692846 RepID=UPI00168A1091|nr:nucleotidyltransferase domain-containing protein [Oscillatoria sp. FACHB-1406]MBD2580098.1 nucleotidyltransferase domain-containing protein [Oscillatoria sp. FACHB-1406]
MNRLEVENRTILLALTGSRGYGLATETSDYDYRGVFIATQPYYLGFKDIEQKDSGWTEEAGNFEFLGQDTAIYELRKFLKLSVDNNPNILELLWFKDYAHLTEVGKVLLANRRMFLSKRVKSTYTGYGYAQIKKLESHRRWLLDPPTQKPTPAEFGLQDTPPLSISDMNSFLQYLYLLVRDRIQFLEPAGELYRLLTAEIDYKGVLKQYDLPEETLAYTQKLAHTSKDFIKLLQLSQRYHKAVQEYKNYQQWKKNRNPARAAMEAKVGYDCKFAMQAIRLLKTGIEVLETQQVIVDRREAGDAEELLAMKQGKYSYDEIMAIANQLYQQLDVACKNSTLPPIVDREAASELCVELVQMQGFSGNRS